ncbi:MAG TPA: hypothetical protein DCE42_27150 [Myxococcales bacterium]|nr:hypothetical protein [Deltaproteobacteria bacterium]HAA58470.1 hypothetical protein [Myxococcales bacterium]
MFNIRMWRLVLYVTVLVSFSSSVVEAKVSKDSCCTKSTAHPTTKPSPSSAPHTTGRVRWRSLKGMSISTIARGEKGALWLGTSSGTIVKIDETGKRVWSSRMAGPLTGLYRHPLTGDMLVSLRFGMLRSVGKKGQKKWNVRLMEALTSSPVCTQKGVCYVGGHDMMLRAFDAKGKVLWEKTLMGKIVASSTLSTQGHVYTPVVSGFVYAHQSVNKGKKSTTKGAWGRRVCRRITGAVEVRSDGYVWVPCASAIGKKSGSIVALDAVGKPRWSFFAKGAILSKPIEGEKKSLYTVDDRGYLYKVSSKGVMLWKKALGAALSFVVRDPKGNVYVGDARHRVHSFTATGKRRWRVLLEGYVTAPPLFVPGTNKRKGTLYIATSKGLYALHP